MISMKLFGDEPFYLPCMINGGIIGKEIGLREVAGTEVECEWNRVCSKQKRRDKNKSHERLKITNDEQNNWDRIHVRPDTTLV